MIFRIIVMTVVNILKGTTCCFILSIPLDSERLGYAINALNPYGVKCLGGVGNDH